MKSLRRSFFAALITLLSWPVFSEAPVVDDSENFALFDKHRAENQRPDVHQNQRYNQASDDIPLAHEDNMDDHANGNNVELLNKLQGLQQDIQELRGQLEIQTHDLNALRQQQIDFYKDLDARVRHEPITKPLAATPSLSLDTPAITATNNALPMAKPQPEQSPQAGLKPEKNAAPQVSLLNTGDEQASYLAAYDLINNKRFDEALPAMQLFIQKYPQGGYTANAQYWMGELYMVKKDYPQAIEHFEHVLQQFPASSKSSASMLKIGYALAAAGKISEAKQRLQSVIKKYPDTHAAQLALAKLETINIQ